jgi:hypothetical protein
MGQVRIPPHAQLSPGAEFRHDMFIQSTDRLRRMARKALTVTGKKNNECVAVCIEVDDPTQRWKYIVDALMPHEDWSKVRKKKIQPVARGIALWSVCTVIAKELPELQKVLLEVPFQTTVIKVIVLGKGGCTVYDMDTV